MRTELFDYNLPEELIAQTPIERGASRLMVLDRAAGTIAHRLFTDLPQYLRPDDLLVLNDTRVSARRLHAVREDGSAAEVFLLKPIGERGCEALVRPGRRLKPGRSVTVQGPGDDQAAGLVTAETPEGGRIIEFASATVRDALLHWGETPLPPYIHTPLTADQEERYQTVYSAHPGSAAAPTAGLHFSDSLLRDLKANGVREARLTLTVGVGTFRPVKCDEIEDHTMHGEEFDLSEAAAEAIDTATGRVVAVGTTSVRTLEACATLAEEQKSGRRVVAAHGETSIFLSPGSKFRAVDAMITNFHLPKSTLIMLVSAFAGREFVMQAYEEAIRERYRFFSFGDAMLII